MFEYLMPLLVMPTYEHTLLDQTYQAVVRRQIEYGRQRGVPWGISESGYNTTDTHLNYQYKAFGVPGLGLKRGLAEDLVVAPYAASVMGLMVAPEAACRNLELLAEDGSARGATDFTKPSTTHLQPHDPHGKTSVTIRQFMAHHEGMSLLSLAYRAARQTDAAPFRCRPNAACRRSVAAGARAQSHRRSVFPHAAEASATRV